MTNLPSTPDKKARPVHPVAALFPMLAPDELTDLADDIAAHGLLHPIVLDQNGQVLDGRNRLAACEKAGVEPIFETYDGKNPDAYALSVNITRRHLTKGQAAMIAVKAKSLGPKETGWKQRAAQAVDVSSARISQASLVVEYAPELSSNVMTGTVSLDSAYARAQERKAPAPVVKPPPRRKPLTDAYKFGLLDLEKSIERLERLTKDDRFSQHGPHLRGCCAANFDHLMKRLRVVGDRLNDDGFKIKASGR